MYSHVEGDIQPSGLTIFDITYIEHEDDLISFLIAICSLLPIFGLLFHAGTIFFMRRELFSITALIGALWCVLLNEGLKRVIKDPRPEGSYKGGYGMPSNHTQLAFFYVSMVVLALFARNTFQHYFWKYAVVATTILGGILVAISRVDAGVHSWEQVIVGGIVGSMFGSFWFALSHYFLAQFFPYIERYQIAKYLFIFDGSHVPNMMLFEYNSYHKKKEKYKKK